MRLHHVNSYAASPAQVHAMLVSPEFREKVCASQQALSHSVEITTDGDTTEVVVTQSQAMDGAPAAARKIVGSSVDIVQKEIWRTVDTADYSVEIPGKPARLTGGITLQERDGGCDEVFTGDVKVSIPLVGGKLEGFIADIVVGGLRREGRVGAQWLEGGSGGSGGG